MEIFSALLAICARNSPVTGKFPTKRPMTRSFDVFFDLRLNKRLNKQLLGWWFEPPSRPLWRHSNANTSSKTDTVRVTSGSQIWLREATVVLVLKNVCLSVGTTAPFYKHGLILISAWKTKHAHNEVWNDIPFLKVNGAAAPLKFRKG